MSRGTSPSRSDVVPRKRRFVRRRDTSKSAPARRASRGTRRDLSEITGAERGGRERGSPVAFTHIELLLKGSGEITMGAVGPIRCAAFAVDDVQQLVALVRRRGESVVALLERLDAAVAKAWNEEVFTDEINGPG